MKNSIQYFLISFCFFISIIITCSSNSYAEGAPLPPGIYISNATLNGVPISFGCGLFAHFPNNSHLEFDVAFDVYNEHADISYTFSPLSPPGSPTFTPPIPAHVVQGYYVHHFSWTSPAQYFGFLNLFVNDRINPPVSCILNFDISLPVELSSFASAVENNVVVLNWFTSSEMNNSGFELERSNVNIEIPASHGGSNNWKKISFIPGNGTTSSPNNYEFKDRNLSSGKYKYRLKQIDFNGNFEYFNLANEVNIGIPDKFSLSQNYPNPFNPTTKISYDLPFDGKVSLKIFDVSGKEIMNLINQNKTAGFYEEVINGYNFSSGVYFYRLTFEGNGMNFDATKKMVMTK